MSFRVGSLVSCNDRSAGIYKVTALSSNGEAAKIQMWNGAEESVPTRILRPAAKYAIKQRVDFLMRELEFLGAVQ